MSEEELRKFKDFLKDAISLNRRFLLNANYNGSKTREPFLEGRLESYEHTLFWLEDFIDERRS